MIHDESAQKKQRSLAKLEKKYGTIFRNIVEPMISIDPDQRPSYHEILAQVELLGMQSVKNAVYTDRKLLQIGYQAYQRMIRDNKINVISNKTYLKNINIAAASINFKMILMKKWK